MEACVHELDVVRLRAPSKGESYDGQPVAVPAGTDAAVIMDYPGSDLLRLEVIDQGTGVPTCFVVAARSSVDVIWRHTPIG